MFGLTLEVIVIGIASPIVFVLLAMYIAQK